MLMSVLMYGLIGCALLQPRGHHRTAAWIMVAGVISVDILYQFGILYGHAYYLYAVVATICVSVVLVHLNCSRLVNALLTACIAMMIMNSADWLAYTYSDMRNDALYESIFLMIYMYAWYVMRGKGGADVVGRIKHFGAGIRYIHNHGSAKQRCGDSHKV